jgi:ABC-type tungstate transport system substrate-binding protein
VDVLRAALPALSDAELRDLAARAAVLETDPLGAMDQDIKLLVIILLIALIVVVILSAVD